MGCILLLKDKSAVSYAFRFIQAFISSELVDREEAYWIGLRSTGSAAQWSTGQELDYAHFEKDEPVHYFRLLTGIVAFSLSLLTFGGLCTLSVQFTDYSKDNRVI